MNVAGAYQNWYLGTSSSGSYVGGQLVNNLSYDYTGGSIINGWWYTISANIYSCLIAPTTDVYDINYYTPTSGINLVFDDVTISSRNANCASGNYTFTVNLIKGQIYPVYVQYYSCSALSYFTFNWRTQGGSFVYIPDSAFALCEVAGSSPFNINVKASICGDGYLTGSEACDDGNTSSMDGCAADCNSIESNYKCTGGSSSSKDVCTLCPSGTYQLGTTSPNQCAPICGDGKVVSPEVCDDGNVNNGDGCNNSCTIIEAGYMCAGGSSTSKDTCSHCTTGFYSQGTSTPSSCVSKCGDGILAGSENCDDGNTNSGDGCNSSCSLIETNYKCSGGSLSNKDTCTLCSIGYYQQGNKSPNSCITQCGDGKLVGSEACDDGNISNGDGCSSICTIESGYKCTGGSYSTKDTCSLCPARTIQQGTVSPNACANLCGNGKLDVGEACDDGNSNSGDGCNSDCSSIETNYSCAGGSSMTKDICSICSFGFYSQGTQSPNSCITHCGDSKLAGLEACDDGNTNNSDGCSSDCTTIEAGYKCTGGTYSSKDICTLCPTGTIQQGTTSPNSCLSLCGDGKLQTSESCDDGNSNNGDGCSSSCMIENGYKCTGGTKTSKDTCVLCDPGTYQQGTASPNSCAPLCGDGKLAGGEACDDGNTANGDGCNSICTSIESNYRCAGGSPISRDTCMLCPVGTIQQGTISPNVCGTSCGNGKLEGDEACDDGNTNSGDGCNSNCSSIESGYKCTGGTINSKDICIICPIGYHSKGITSPNQCSITCGDGLKIESEQCDDGNLANGDGCNSMCIIENGFFCSGGSATSKDVCSHCYFYQNACVKACPDKTFYDNTTKICSNCSNNCASCYGSSSSQCSTCNSGYTLLNNTCASNSLISSANFISAVSYILVLMSLIVMLMKNCNLPPRPDESRSVYKVPSSNSQSLIPRISDYNYQFFWIIINTYQMLVLLLLLKADFHEAMIKLLSSFSFSTFNFEFIRIAFINNAQNSLNNPLNSSSWNFVSAMKNAGFRTGYLFADYLYLLIFLVIFCIAHIVFRVFFRIHKDQTSTSNDLKHKFKELFEFRIYVRIFLCSFLFLMLEIFVQFGSNQNSTISMFSLILAIGILCLLMFLTIVAFIHFAKSRFKSSVSKAKLTVLYEGLKGKQLALAYSSIWLIQRLIIAIDLAFIRISFPQTIILIVVQLAFTMYIVFMRPFTNRVDNVIGIVCGGFTFLIYCMFLIIQDSFNLRDDEIEQRTAAIIYLMLALSLIGLLLFLGYVVYEIIKFFKSRKMSQIVHHADIKIEVKSNVEELKAENPMMKYKERSQILDEVRIEEEKLCDISKLPPL